MATKALPQGSLILVTGINGYIGSHIADKLLGLGYRVRGTARDDKKMQPVLETLRLRNPQAQVDGVIVPDISLEGAFHDAVQDCDGVIHVASDLSFSPDPNKTVKTTVEGLRSALKAASSVSTVKRFVYTSSSTAAAKAKANTVFHVDSNSWNEEDIKVAWAPPPYEQERAFAVYSASKAESERMAWEFVKRQDQFVFNAVLPNLNVGPILDPSQSASTAGWVNGLHSGDEFSTQFIVNLPPQYQIDVEDCALIHVAALLEPDVRNERLFAYNQRFNYSDIVGVLKKLDPKKTDYPEAPNEDRDLSTVANERALELVRRYGRERFRSLEESLRRQFGVVV